MRPSSSPPQSISDRASHDVHAYKRLVPERLVTDVAIPLDADQPVRNRLLASLPAADLAALRPHLRIATLELRDVLFEQEKPIRAVWFPETAVVSLTSTLREGGTVEVGTAGREGIAGLEVFLGDETSTVRAIVQINGTAYRMDAATFSRLSCSAGPFHLALLRYTQAFMTQVAQTAACNGAHFVEQRCARWLLMTHDRVDGDELPLTHEFLAFMLGVRRAGVTLAMRALQDAQLVRYSRGHVTITDREGLERASCECYGTVRRHFERLLVVGETERA